MAAEERKLRIAGLLQFFFQTQHRGFILRNRSCKRHLHPKAECVSGKHALMRAVDEHDAARRVSLHLGNFNFHTAAKVDDVAVFDVDNILFRKILARTVV